jgi:predicted phosphodiesterase
MTILVTADWHLNDNPRDEYRHQFQRKLRGLVEDNQATTVVMLGDLTEAKEGHNAHLVNRIMNQLALLSRLAHVIILKGNHDYIDPACPFFGFVHHMPNIEWVGKPCVLKIDGKYYTFLPHTDNYKADWHPSFFKGSTVFAHATFKGAVSESGRELDGIPRDAIVSGLPVIAGDVHVPQTIGHVTYVGSPYTIKFGDDFVPRVLIIKKGRITSVPCPGQQKRLIRVTSLDEAKKKIQSKPKDIMKVQIAWDGQRIEEWRTARRDLLEWSRARGIELHGVEAVVDAPERAKKYQAGQAQRDDEIIAAYCKANDVNQVLEKVGQKIAKG